MLYNIATSEF